MRNKIIQGNVLDPTTWTDIPDQHIQCCITSPPYWGLRDYGVVYQLGLEPTPKEYIERMVQVFRHVWRVLRDDGTLWLNLGDSYCSPPAGNKKPSGFQQKSQAGQTGSLAQYAHGTNWTRPPGLKPKDLCGIPWRVALALQSDGWYLRQDIIWHKPNPMPESCRDRCTKAHEYIFLLTKKPRYFCDMEAIKEPASVGCKDTDFLPNSDKDKVNQNASIQTAAVVIRLAGRTGRIVRAGVTRATYVRGRVSAAKPSDGSHGADTPVCSGQEQRNVASLVCPSPA